MSELTLDPARDDHYVVLGRSDTTADVFPQTSPDAQSSVVLIASASTAATGTFPIPTERATSGTASPQTRVARLSSLVNDVMALVAQDYLRPFAVALSVTASAPLSRPLVSRPVVASVSTSIGGHAPCSASTATEEPNSASPETGRATATDAAELFAQKAADAANDQRSIQDIDEVALLMLSEYGPYGLTAINTWLQSNAAKQYDAGSVVLRSLGSAIHSATHEARFQLIASYLANDAPAIRDAAALALVSLGDKRAAALLGSAADSEPIPELRGYLLDAQAELA